MLNLIHWLDKTFEDVNLGSRNLMTMNQFTKKCFNRLIDDENSFSASPGDI